MDAACRRIRGSDRTLIAERVRDLLADRYRRVVVQPQDPLAATADDLVLYVYRDGHPAFALGAAGMDAERGVRWAGSGLKRR